MRQHQPYLGDFFAKARSEPPVTSQEEIEQLLDMADLHGRQPAQSRSAQTTAHTHSQNNNRKRRIAMGSIAALLFGTVISAGLVLFGPETPTDRISVPALPGTSAVLTTPLAANANKGISPTLALPDATAPAEQLNGHGNDGKTDVSVEGEKDEDGADKIKEKIGKEISRELQGLVENYWMDKINGYKARIDGMLSRSDLDELNRLRVRWALADKSLSPLAFAAQMEMNAVNANGEQVQVEAGIGNAPPTPPTPTQIITPDGATSSTTKMSLGFTLNSTSERADKTEDASGKTVTMTKEVHIVRHSSDGDMTELSNIEGLDGKGISLTNSADGKTVSIAIAPDVSTLEGVDTEGAIAIALGGASDDTVTIDNKADRTIIFRRNAIGKASEEDSDDALTVDNKGAHKIIVRRNTMGEESETSSPAVKISTTTMHTQELSMAPMMGMLKKAIQADNSEPSQIMVATWDIADDHRAALDDLKATILSDVATFATLVREKMQEYVAEHGEELPTEMRERMSDKTAAPQEENTANLLKTLEPIYNVIIEPMLLLYNGSDINGMLTSAIAEPVAGITLEANSTLKQSYPNPASAEATIEYMLQEPSSTTTLRLFDAQGSEVRNLNLGTQNAGNHQTVVDVHDLPAGTYLYHLTIGTPRGEQVFSKTMQIVR